MTVWISRYEKGKLWVASVREGKGDDYKGRFEFVVEPVEGERDALFALNDVRWNSRETAARTLDTMSIVELRRRLRWALGRAGRPVRP